MMSHQQSMNVSHHSPSSSFDDSDMSGLLDDLKFFQAASESKIAQGTKTQNNKLMRVRRSSTQSILNRESSTTRLSGIRLPRGSFQMWKKTPSSSSSNSFGSVGLDAPPFEDEFASENMPSPIQGPRTKLTAANKNRADKNLEAKLMWMTDSEVV